MFGSENFPQLYLRLKTPILRYVRRTIPDGETAEELTQEVFLKAFRSRDTYESERSVTTWLWTIARNTVCDWHRKHAGEPWRAASHSGEADEPVCETLPSPSPDAEALASRRSERKELKRQLRGLTRLQRRVLWLRIVRGFSYQEISARLGMSISAAKCAFYRARLALTAQAGELALAY